MIKLAGQPVRRGEGIPRRVQPQRHQHRRFGVETSSNPNQLGDLAIQRSGSWHELLLLFGPLWPPCKCRHLPHLFASMPDVAQAPLPATMRAVVWRGDHDPGQMRIEVLRMPEPKANEVLIKVRACGGYVRTWPVWQASAAEPADWPRPTEAPRADLSNLRWEKPAESPLAEGRAALFSTQVRCVPHRPPLHQGRGTLPAARGLRPRDLRRGGPLRPAGGGG